MLSVTNPALPLPRPNHHRPAETGSLGEWLDATAHFSSRRYSRGESLCLEGHPATGIFVLLSGRAKEYLTSPRGKTAIVRIARPGDLVAVEPMVSGVDYLTTVDAIEDTVARFIPKRDFMGLMLQDEGFRLKVTQQLGERCRCAYSSVRRMGFAASMPARIAHFLLQWPENGPAPKTIRGGEGGITQEEISSIVGATRETVSRVIASFRRQGWIRREGASWQIIKKDLLSDLAREQCAAGGSAL